jgi:hypothetical protein
MAVFRKTCLEGPIRESRIAANSIINIMRALAGKAYVSRVELCGWAVNRKADQDLRFLAGENASYGSIATRRSHSSKARCGYT